MTMNFAAAMRAATELTRAGKPMDATRLIQEMLLVGDARDASEPTTARAIAGPPLDAGLIDVTPKLAGGETTVPEEAWRAPDSMRELADSLLAMRCGLAPGGLMAPVRARKAVQIPDGAQFLSRIYANAAGSRSYKLYVPSGDHKGKRPLLIMLHGGTQDADDFAAGTRMNALAEERGLIVAYPNQCKAANASLCWNWFQPEHQRHGAGEPSIIAGIAEEIVAEHRIDRDRIFVAGLSAGGAMAAVMAATYPDLFAAIGVHSGLPYRSANNVASAFAAMHGKAPLRKRGARKSERAVAGARTPTIVFHGDADRIVHPSNAARLLDAHAKRGDVVERISEPAGAVLGHSREIARDENGAVVMERWLVHGSAHAWSGGSPDGSYTDPRGPDASREMLRFFLQSVTPPRRK